MEILNRKRTYNNFEYRIYVNRAHIDYRSWNVEQSNMNTDIVLHRHFDITNRERKEFINYHYWYEIIDGVYVEQSDFMQNNNVGKNNNDNVQQNPVQDQIRPSRPRFNNNGMERYKSSSPCRPSSFVQQIKERNLKREAERNNVLDKIRPLIAHKKIVRNQESRWKHDLIQRMMNENIENVFLYHKDDDEII
jgi:hypothetical protein